MLCRRASLDLGSKTRAYEHSDNQHLAHTFVFTPFFFEFEVLGARERILSAAPLSFATELVRGLFRETEKSCGMIGVGRAQPNRRDEQEPNVMS